MAKLKKEPKIHVEDVLFAFYDKISVWDNIKQVEVGKFIYPPDKYYPDEDNNYRYDWEVVGYDNLDLHDKFDRLMEVMKENRDKYSSIFITFDQNGDYCYHYRIVGRRLETIPEYDSRIQELAKKERQKQLAKEAKAQRTLENKKKKLAQLKKELGE